MRRSTIVKGILVIGVVVSALALLPCVGQSTLQASAPCEVRYANGVVRQQPHSNARVVSELSDDMEVRACENSGNFRRVEPVNGGSAGWMENGSLKDCVTRYVGVRNAKFVSKPSKDASVVGSADYGLPVNVCETVNGFSRCGNDWIETKVMVSGTTNVEDLLQAAVAAEISNDLIKATALAERAARIAETKQGLTVQLRLAEKQKNTAKATDLRTKLDDFDPKAGFTPETCFDFVRHSNDSSDALAKNQWIKSRYEPHSEAGFGMRPFEIYRFGNGSLANTGNLGAYTSESVYQIDCKKKLMLRTGSIGDCGGGSWMKLVSLIDGKTETLSEESRISKNLDFLLVPNYEAGKSTLSIQNCRRFAETGKCQQIGSEKVWIGKNVDCGDEDPACSDVFCELPKFTSDIEFEVNKSPTQKVKCVINAEGTTVVCK